MLDNFEKIIKAKIATIATNDDSAHDLLKFVFIKPFESLQKAFFVLGLWIWGYRLEYSQSKNREHVLSILSQAVVAICIVVFNLGPT